MFGTLTTVLRRLISHVENIDRQVHSCLNSSDTTPSIVYSILHIVNHRYMSDLFDLGDEERRWVIEVKVFCGCNEEHIWFVACLSLRQSTHFVS